MRTKTFDIKGIRWDVTTNESGTKKAVATCPEHPQKVAILEGTKAIGVLVSCPEYGCVLEMCSREEFEAQEKNAKA